MNKRVFWFLGFLVVAGISCWATATSFHLMMPNMPIVAVWGMTIVFFVLASWAVKLIVEAVDDTTEVSHPKFQLWSSLLLLVFTWIIVSLPTNAHTFFYNLKIGDVVTDDLKTTEQYSEQLANRVNIDSAFFDLEDKVNKEWNQFSQEVINGAQSGKTGIGQAATKHIDNINTLFGTGYQIPLPTLTHHASLAQLTNIVNQWKLELVDPVMQKIKSDKYQVSLAAAKDARNDMARIRVMEDSIHQLVMTNDISSSDAEPIIKQCEGVLVVAYSNIKSNNQFVVFLDKDKELYTADPLETKTTRFLNPYSVAHDFFTGKIPASFTFWLLLSILIDVSGFIFFDLAFKKEQF